jgi:hypothetical protein
MAYVVGSVTVSCYDACFVDAATAVAGVAGVSMLKRQRSVRQPLLLASMRLTVEIAQKL